MNASYCNELNGTKSTAPSERTRLRRRPDRAAYDRDTIHAILDAGLVCHLGFASGDDGQPFVLPTVYGRIGDDIYLHGSAAGRLCRTLGAGVPMCMTVTHVDGLVLARSAMHHSMNYRSVVVLGTATPVTDLEEKLVALRAIVNHITPRRWDDVREPNPQELKATSVLRLPISETSAKVRTGGPIDDAADMDWPVWAGQIPLRLVALDPIPDGDVPGHAPAFAGRMTA
jgi:nitroimidazol reductase NimA-like FMN-containing flavoprotein (pyridoxamine 5'-phosphate oxidase superfamily)